MLNKIFIVLLVSSFGFSAYSVGQTVSISDQQLVMSICNGSEPNGETDGEMSLYDYNGEFNGGEYYVIHIDLTAAW